jgi:trans-aconitate methyltransferase
MGSPSQHWSAADYARNARFVAEYGAEIVDLLAPLPGERILDLGCGDGALTARIAASGAAVVAVDGAADMVRAARDLGLDARVMDGHALSFSHEFDAVFSNAALHWMSEPDRVLAGVARAGKPGARFVGEMGGHGNVAAIATALRAVIGADISDFSWYFPTAEEYAEKLRAHGFSVRSIELIYRPTELPTGMLGWLQTFAAPFLSGVPQERHGAVLAAVCDVLAPALRDSKGRWFADYVRLRFQAVLA